MDEPKFFISSPIILYWGTVLYLDHAHNVKDYSKLYAQLLLKSPSEGREQGVLHATHTGLHLDFTYCTIQLSVHCCVPWAEIDGIQLIPALQGASMQLILRPHSVISLVYRKSRSMSKCLVIYLLPK